MPGFDQAVSEAPVAPVAPTSVPAASRSGSSSVSSQSGKELAQAVKEWGHVTFTSAVGAVLGAVLWKKHRYIGLLAGASFGSAVAELRYKRYSYALSDAAAGSLGTYFSLRSPNHPAWGYVGGHVLGKVAGSTLGGLAFPSKPSK